MKKFIKIFSIYTFGSFFIAKSCRNKTNSLVLKTVNDLFSSSLKRDILEHKYWQSST